MIEVRRGTQKLYKGHYFIVFYDKDDEWLRYMFDNAREILKFLGKPITRYNVANVNHVIAKALSSESHITKLIKGEPLRVHIIDIN